MPFSLTEEQASFKHSFCLYITYNIAKHKSNILFNISIYFEPELRYNLTKR